MKILLLSYLMIATLSSYAQKTSYDPTSISFIMWFRDSLVMESDRNPAIDMQCAFGKDYQNVMCVHDSLWFIIKPTYYKVWIPEIQTVFRASVRKQSDIGQVPESLIAFINTIRLWRQSKQITSTQ